MALSEDQQQLLQQSLSGDAQLGGGPAFVRVDRSRGVYLGVHVIVVWDAWEGIQHAERGKDIVDAYQAVHGAPRGLEVKLAMGLTEAEARRQNIEPTKDNGARAGS